ncbi:hypothetical protein HDU67_008263 [Dinochytrium kinnereticum]|nr:hypothetical protein HDU67_008263 [Dinochytrium kinnereticum]
MASSGNPSGSWFNLDARNLQNINLSSIASKVTSIMKESPFSESSSHLGDPDSYRKKHDDDPLHIDNGFDGEIEEPSFEDLKRMNRDLRMELQRTQQDLHEEISSRDNHIKALEARLVAMRQSAASPPQSPSQDSDRAALLQEKLNKAVSHLKPLIEENKSLSARLEDKEKNESRLFEEIRRLKSQSAPVESSSDLLAVSEWKEKYDFMKEHVANLEETVTELNEKDLELRKKLDSVTKADKAKAKELDELHRTIKDLRQQTADHPIAAGVEEELKEQLQKLILEKASLDSQLKTATEERSEALEAVEKLSEDFQKKLVKLEEEKNARKQTFQSELEKRQAEIAASAAQVSQLYVEMETLSKSLSERDEKIANMDEELGALIEVREQTSRKEAEIQRLEKDILALSQKLKDLKVENIELEGRLQETDKSNSDASDLQAEKKRLGEELQSLQSANELALAEFERERQTLIEEAAQITIELENKHVAFQAEAAQVASLSSKLEANVASISALEAENEAIFQKMESAQKEILALSSKVEALSREKAALQSQLDDAFSNQRESQFNNDALKHDRESIIAPLAYLSQQFYDYILCLNENGEPRGILFSGTNVPDEVSDSLLSLQALCEKFQDGLRTKERTMAELRDNVTGEDIVVPTMYPSDLNAEIEERTGNLSAVHQELSILREEKDRITSEHALLVEKLSTVKSSVMPKLQAEMDESNRLREEVTSLNSIISSLREERALLKSEMASLANSDAHLRDISTQNSAESNRLQSELDATVTELEATKSELEKVQRRLSALQHHMAETEEANTHEALRIESTLAEYKTRVESLERERENWEEVAQESQDAVRIAEDRAAEAKEAAEKAREELELALRARERDQLSISNLQSVLEEFQAAKEGEIEFELESLKKQLQTATKSLEEYRERALKAEEQISELDVDAPNLSELETELQEKSVEVGRLRARVISLESYLAEAIRRAGSPDNQVDRRLISNLVVQFMSTARGDTKRFEMLSVIANVLRLTDEDKVKIGLLRKVGANPPPTSPSAATGESFTDLWISFLIRESGNAHLKEEVDLAKKGEAATTDPPGFKESEKQPPADLTASRRGSNFFSWKKD